MSRKRQHSHTTKRVRTIAAAIAVLLFLTTGFGTRSFAADEIPASPESQEAAEEMTAASGETQEATGEKAGEPAVRTDPAPAQDVTPGTETPAPAQDVTPGTETPAPAQDVTPGTETPAPAQDVTPGTETPAPAAADPAPAQEADPAQEAENAELIAAAEPAAGPRTMSLLASPATPAYPSVTVPYKAIVKGTKEVIREGTLTVSGEAHLVLNDHVPEIEGYTYTQELPGVNGSASSALRLICKEETDGEGNVSYVVDRVERNPYSDIGDRYWRKVDDMSAIEVTFVYTPNATEQVSLYLSFDDYSGSHIYEIAPVPYTMPDGTDVVDFYAANAHAGLPEEITFTADEGVEGRFRWWKNTNGATVMRAETDPEKLAAEKANKNLRYSRSLGTAAKLYREAGSDGITRYYFVNRDGARYNITEDVEFCMDYAPVYDNEKPTEQTQTVALDGVTVKGSLYRNPNTGELSYLNNTPVGWKLVAEQSTDAAYFAGMNNKKTNLTDVDAPDFAPDNTLVYELSVWGPPKYVSNWGFVKKDAAPTEPYKPQYMTFQFTFNARRLSEQMGITDQEDLIIAVLTKAADGTVSVGEPYRILHTQLGASGDDVTVWLKNVAAVAFSKKQAAGESVSGDGLQEQINNAPDGVQTTISVDELVKLEKSLYIPQNKNIVLAGEGRITGEADKAIPLVDVHAGAVLTLNGVTLHADNTGSTYGHGSAVDVNGTLYLQSGTVYGGHVIGNDTGVIRVGKGGVFEMSGGTIRDMSGLAYWGGAVNVTSGARFVMRGGEICDNVNDASSSVTSRDMMAGGVAVNNYYNGDPAVFEMSGGTIARNRGGSGGGVNIFGNASFVLSGGTIEGNSVAGYGGGVCVSGAWNGYSRSAKNVAASAFEMTGGTVSGNSAGHSGGGIYVNSDHAVLKAGVISGNRSAVQGGGVYVSEDPRLLQMENTLVTGNTATGSYATEGMGGGIWACPTGAAQLYVTSGIAVVDNSASMAGDDLVNTRGAVLTVHLSERMLGGGKVDYYKDGSVSPVMPYGNASGKDRFDPEQPGEPVDITALNGKHASFALKTVATPEAVTLAKQEHKLLVTGNTSPRGGGIGTNGDVVIGYPGETELEVLKVWDENVPAEQRREVSIKLVIDGVTQENDQVVLNEENQWTAAFTGFPAHFDFGRVRVIESPAEDFVVTYDGEGTARITVTNRLPDEPPPEDPPPEDPPPEDPPPGNPPPGNPPPNNPPPNNPPPENPPPENPPAGNPPADVPQVAGVARRTTGEEPQVLGSRRGKTGDKGTPVTSQLHLVSAAIGALLFLTGKKRTKRS